MEVLAAMDKLQLPKVYDVCVKFLEKSVNSVNVCTILTASRQMNLVPLQEAWETGRNVTKDLKNVTKDVTISIISSPKLCATEEKVFEAVLFWGEVVTSWGSDDGDAVGGCGDVVSDLLLHLWLDEMEDTFLYNRVKEAGLFSA